MTTLLCFPVGLVFPRFQDIKTPCFSGGAGLCKFARHQDPLFFRGGWSFQVCNTSRPLLCKGAGLCMVAKHRGGGVGLSTFAKHREPPPHPVFQGFLPCLHNVETPVFQVGLPKNVGPLVSAVVSVQPSPLEQGAQGLGIFPCGL